MWGWGARGGGDQDKEGTSLGQVRVRALGVQKPFPILSHGSGHCSLPRLVTYTGEEPAGLPFVPRGEAGVGPGASWNLLTRAGDGLSHSEYQRRTPRRGQQSGR